MRQDGLGIERMKGVQQGYQLGMGNEIWDELESGDRSVLSRRRLVLRRGTYCHAALARTSRRQQRTLGLRLVVLLARCSWCRVKAPLGLQRLVDLGGCGEFEMARLLGHNG